MEPAFVTSKSPPNPPVKSLTAVSMPDRNLSVDVFVDVFVTVSSVLKSCEMPRISLPPWSDDAVFPNASFTDILKYTAAPAVKIDRPCPTISEETKGRPWLILRSTGWPTAVAWKRFRDGMGWKVAHGLLHNNRITAFPFKCLYSSVILFSVPGLSCTLAEGNRSFSRLQASIISVPLIHSRAPSVSAPRSSQSTYLSPLGSFRAMGTSSTPR